MASVAEVKDGLNKAIEHANDAPIDAAKETLKDLSPEAAAEKLREAMGIFDALIQRAQEVPVAEIEQKSQDAVAQVNAATEGSDHTLVDAARTNYTEMGRLANEDAGAALAAFQEKLTNHRGVLSGMIESLEGEVTADVATADGKFDEAAAGGAEGTQNLVDYMAGL